MNELQNEKGATSNSDKNKILEMLKRLEDEDNNDEAELIDEMDSDDESIEEGDLAVRLEEVDLNDADAVWERLTANEKEEFKSIIYNNEIEKIVQQIEPFWSGQNLENLPVIDIEENQKLLEKIKESCPKVLINIKDFSKISTKPPAKCIIFNIANVIGTYTYIYRFYNGDHNEYTLEAVDNFIKICDNIKANVNYENLTSVVDSIILNCQNQSLFADSTSKSLMMKDLQEIFDGPCESSNFFLLSALSDVINLFEAAKLMIKRERKEKKSGKFSSQFPDIENVQNYKELENQTHFNNCLRKLEFYISFLNYSYNSRDWKIEF